MEGGAAGTAQPEGEAVTIEEFIEARIGEDETIARGAIDPNRPGTNWYWATTHDGTPVPDGEEAQPLDEGHHLSLRTLEEFPPVWDPSRTLPAFIIGADGGFPGGLRHIARHDPARVLRQCAAFRVALHWYVNDDEMVMGGTIQAIAAIWSDHPDYRKEWAE